MVVARGPVSGEPGKVKIVKSSTAYNHLVRLKAAMISVYSAAEAYCSPHSHILAELDRRVWQDPALKKAPSWVRQALGDLSSARLERIQRDLVVWLFKRADGSATSWERLTDVERAEYCGLDKKGAHYWIRRASLNGSEQITTGETLSRRFVVTDKTF